MKTTILILSTLLLTGCYGIIHKSYLPRVHDASYEGPITMRRIDDPAAHKEAIRDAGLIIIGTSHYGGDLPETDDMRRQARRVGASSVYYGVEWIPNPPGTWAFGFGGGSGWGRGGGGHSIIHITFLGE